MPNTKLHPSIILHVTNEDTRYIVGNREVSADDVAQVSDELWEVTLSVPEKPRRTPRNEDVLWG